MVGRAYKSHTNIHHIKIIILKKKKEKLVSNGFVFPYKWFVFFNKLDVI